ncbi:MAG: RimK/LysX family protein, partial [Rickettsiales bacterium]
MLKRKRALLTCLGLCAAGYAGFLFHQHYGVFTGHADTVIGRVERVYVKDARFGEPARIDTGAGLSSVHAEIITIKKPEKEGDSERVVFRLPNEKAEVQTLERDIIGWQNIKKKGNVGYTKRPVVMLKLCIA